MLASPSELTIASRSPAAASPASASAMPGNSPISPAAWAFSARISRAIAGTFQSGTRRLRNTSRLPSARSAGTSSGATRRNPCRSATGPSAARNQGRLLARVPS